MPERNEGCGVADCYYPHPHQHANPTPPAVGRPEATGAEEVCLCAAWEVECPVHPDVDRYDALRADHEALRGRLEQLVAKWEAEAKGHLDGSRLLTRCASDLRAALDPAGSDEGEAER